LFRTFPAKVAGKFEKKFCHLAMPCKATFSGTFCSKLIKIKEITNSYMVSQLINCKNIYRPLFGHFLPNFPNLRPPIFSGHGQFFEPVLSRLTEISAIWQQCAGSDCHGILIRILQNINLAQNILQPNDFQGFFIK
jgi:hypothetical protein